MLCSLPQMLQCDIACPHSILHLNLGLTFEHRLAETHREEVHLKAGEFGLNHVTMIKLHFYS